MNSQTISEIYDGNKQIHEKTKQLAASLTDDQIAALSDGEKWTIAEIIEHVAIVKSGMVRILTKLLSDAQKTGKSSDGTAQFSENFQTKAAEAATLKLEAPERVRPTGKQSVAESLEKMDAAHKEIEKLRPLFESVECSDVKFPHPFMGDLTAHEWLALVGGHEARHLRQIKNRLEMKA